MWCERVLGNLADPEAAERWGSLRHDLLHLDWQDCLSRALRKTTESGVSVRIVLCAGVTLRHGDVLAADDHRLIATHVRPTEVLVARPKTIEQMALLAWEIGNLHVPAQMAGDEVLVVPDGPIEAVLWELDVPHTLQIRRFVPNAVGPGTWVGTAVEPNKAKK